MLDILEIGTCILALLIFSKENTCKRHHAGRNHAVPTAPCRWPHAKNRRDGEGKVFCLHLLPMHSDDIRIRS